MTRASVNLTDLHDVCYQVLDAVYPFMIILRGTFQLSFSSGSGTECVEGDIIQRRFSKWQIDSSSLTPPGLMGRSMPCASEGTIAIVPLSKSSRRGSYRLSRCRGMTAMRDPV